MSTLLAQTDVHAPIRMEQVRVGDAALEAPQFTDDAAAALVVQDAASAEAWLEEKQWGLQWRESDILYQSPRALMQWEGSQTTRANVSRFTVAKHVNSLVPAMMGGIFYDAPPFVLRPRPGTTQATIRAKTAVFASLLEMIEFKTDCEGGITSQVLNGSGVWKWGHCTETVKRKRFLRKQSPLRVTMPFEKEGRAIHTQQSDEFEVKEVTETTWKPFFEYKELGQVMPAPGWKHPNQIHKAKFVIERQYLTLRDLARLRDQDGWHLIPSDEELKRLFFPPRELAAPPSALIRQQASNAIIHHAEQPDQKETEDITNQPLEALERWDKETVKVVLQKKLTIRNEEHGLGGIPYLSANFWNILNAGWGMGVGRLTGSDQRVEQGGTNAALDILALIANQQYLRNRGANAPTQQIRARLGGIIDVDVPEGQSLRDALAIMETPKVPGEVWAVIENAKRSAESVSGADETMVQGVMPQKGGSSIGRTATGAGNLAAAAAARIQGPVGRFVDNVFIPFLKALDFMVNEFMPSSQLRQILGEELGDDFQLDLENFYNASMKFEVLAGAHLAAKKAMAQALPLMIEIFENPHLLQQLNALGQMVDVKELFEMMIEMSEWKNNRSVIRKMTPQEMELYQMMNPALQQMKAQQERDQQKLDGEKQLVDQKAEARMAHDLLLQGADVAAARVGRQAFEHATEPEALMGEAGGSYAAAQ